MNIVRLLAAFAVMAGVSLPASGQTPAPLTLDLTAGAGNPAVNLHVGGSYYSLFACPGDSCAAVNSQQLLGSTWAAPGAIGGTTPNTAEFTALTAVPPSPAWSTSYGAYSGTSSNINNFPVASEFGGNTSSVSQAIKGAIDVPSTATGTLMSGVSGYSRCASTAVDCVGTFGWGLSNAAGVAVWGGNVGVTNTPTVAGADGTGLDVTSLIGFEIDANVAKKSGSVVTNSPVIGLWITGNTSAQSTNVIDDAIDIGPAGAFTAIPWKRAFYSRAGSAGTGIELGAIAATGNTLPSQLLIFDSVSGSSTALQSIIYNDSALGSLTISNQSGACTTTTDGYLGAATFWACSNQVRAFQPFLFPQLLDQSSTPAVGTCGTTPTMTAGSTNSTGQFTTGTGTPTACTVTFSTAWPNNAFCTVAPANSAAKAITGGYYISASSASAFTLTLGTGTSSAAFNYTCAGH